MKKEEKRDYSIDDAIMLTEGQSFLNLFIEHSNDFITDYTIFNAPFAEEMQDDIDICNSSSSDEVCKAKQHLQTVNVEKLMGIGRDEFQEKLLYLKIVFPKNNLKLKLYGKQLYNKARLSHIKLPALIMQAYNMINEDVIKLLMIEKGCSETSMLKLKTAGSNITKAVQKQTKFKGARSISAKDRVKNLNIVWAKMVLISECAKHIYRDNLAMRKLFLLYHDKNATPPPPVPPVTE